MGLAEAHLARLEEPVRKERLRALIQVATTLLAARAVAIEEGEKLLLAEPAFVANVTEMCTAMLEAPWDRTT
jgi:hypothetical protein